MDHKMQIDKKNIAAKPRKLITISRSNLTMLETKILNYFVWRHYWGASENPEYKIKRETLELYKEEEKIGKYITTLSEIKKNINFTSRSTKELVENLHSLVEKAAHYDVFSLDPEEGKIVRKSQGAMSYVDFVDIQEPAKGRKDRIVTYSLGRRFVEVINEMKNGKGQYFYFDFNILSSFRSKYAIALYEFLKMYNDYEQIPEYKIDINFLRFLGAEKPTKYLKKFSNIKTRIIEPAIKQIKERTDMQLDYEIIKKGKDRYLKLTRKDDDKKDFFLFVAKEIMKADKPAAYASKLFKEYKSGNLDKKELKKWQESYKEAVSEKEKKDKLKQMAVQLEDMLYRLYRDSVGEEIQRDNLYVKAKIHGVWYDIKITQLLSYENTYGGILDSIQETYRHFENKDEYVKHFLVYY